VGEWGVGGGGVCHLTSAMKLSKAASSGLKKPSVFKSPIGFWWKPSCCQVITYRGSGAGGGATPPGTRQGTAVSTAKWKLRLDSACHAECAPRHRSPWWNVH